MDDLSPDCIDSILECNELLLDLSVNYQKEQLYQEWLTPLIQQAETLSELLTEPEDETSDPSKPYEEIAAPASHFPTFWHIYRQKKSSRRNGRHSVLPSRNTSL